MNYYFVEHKKNIFSRLKNVTMRIATAIAIASVVLPSGSVEAVGKYAVENHGGKPYIYNDKTGKFIMELKDKDGNVSPFVAFDGEDAYYTVSVTGDSYPYAELLKRMDLSTGESELLRRLPGKWEIYEAKDVCDGSLYLTAGLPSDKNICYRYGLDDGKLKKVADGAFSTRYKHYIICDPSEFFGSIGPLIPIYVYDTENGRTKTVTMRSGGYNVRKGVIYYSDAKTGEAYLPADCILPFCIKARDIETGKTRTLVDEIRATYTEKITDSFVEYSVYSNGEGTKSYRYNIKGETTKEWSGSRLTSCL